MKESLEFENKEPFKHEENKLPNDEAYWDEWARKTINKNGRKVPEIPMPRLLFLKSHCLACGRSFWQLETYRGHYALVHILRVDEF